MALLLGVCISAGLARAQRPIALGINAGVNIASEDSNIQSDTNRETLPGILVTGQTDWPLYGPAVLQDRLSYIGKGVITTRQTLLGSTEKVTTDLRYIELSLAPKVKFGVLDFKPYLFVGPRLGLLVSGNMSTERNGTTSTIEARDNFTTWDFGLDIGAGFSYLIIPRLYMLGDVGYSYGLNNILRQPLGGDNEAFSRDIKVQVGLSLEAFDYESVLASGSR